jgi:hypothetical protein
LTWRIQEFARTLVIPACEKFRVGHRTRGRLAFHCREVVAVVKLIDIGHFCSSAKTGVVTRAHAVTMLASNGVFSPADVMIEWSTVALVPA